MSGARIRFLFDFISPYAYLAWTQVPALAARFGREVEPVPILFAALLNENGTKGPAEIPRKRAYMLKDCIRTAHRLGVPFTMPKAHPFSPLLSLRAATATTDLEARRALVTGLYRAGWGGGGGDLTDPETVARVATEVGLEGRRLVADASLPATKDRLRTETDEALARGVFGVPTMSVDDELFWGLDALANLEMVLGDGDPVTAADVARWGALPASASR